MTFDLYVIALLVASAISFLVFGIVLRKIESQGATSLAVLLVGICFWALFQAFVFIATTYEWKLIFANLRYFGIQASAISFYSLAREYEDQKRSFGWKRWLLISVFPGICLVMLWTNQTHHLFYAATYLRDGNLYLDNGAFFYGNMLYLYLFIAGGLLIFIKTCIKKRSIYRKQALLLASSATLPFIANIAFNSSYWPYKSYDITPLTFLVSATLFVYGLFYIKLLDIVPVARTTILEEMEDLVIVLDNSKRVLELNPSATEMLNRYNRGMEDYIGKALPECLAFWPEFLECIHQTDSVESRVPLVDEDKEEYYHVRISYMHNKKGRRSGYLVVLRNVTTLEKALREAEIARLEAEKANKAKDYFLANMSHEIRTPLNGVIGIAEIMENTELSPERQKEYNSIILRSANSLLDILNDILDFSKIEAGKMTLEFGLFSIKKVARDTMDTFQINAMNKSISLKLEMDPKVEDFLIGDLVRVRQILANLLGNAIKFTDRGSITVSLRKLESDHSTGNSILEMAVTDTGIGISKESIGRIFESFRQADSSTTRKYGGSGLGLSIVKELVELMGGTIEIQSELGEGSRFRCVLPFRVPDETTKKEDEKKSRMPSSSGEMEIERIRELRILVAEDNKVNQEIISLQLRKLGCTFLIEGNGVGVLEKFKNSRTSDEKYDMILMDIMMPEMDGIEATSRIREIESKGSHIPIIALTAGTLNEEVARCYEAGMDDIIPKPIRREALVGAILKNINRTRE